MVAMVAVAMVAMAAELAMAAADVPAVDLAAAEFRTAAADMPSASFARKRGVADDYCERENDCYGRRTHGYSLHRRVAKGY
jgi:hypothetical protein